MAHHFKDLMNRANGEQRPLYRYFINIINILVINFEGWVFELLDQVVVEQAMFQLVDGLPGLGSDLLQSDPDPDQKVQPM